MLTELHTRAPRPDWPRRSFDIGASSIDITHDFATDCNGIRLHYVQAGTGLPVVFLHGFPDFWYSWRHQLRVLPSAGWRCIAPDLRGYNQSDKPRRVRDYRVRELVRDCAAFIIKTAGGAAAVVGHDWGGVIAWYLAARAPQCVSRLVIINAPHPSLYRRALRGRQLLRSWYAGAFQLPVLPELVLSSFHYRLLTAAAARTPDEVEIYEEALSQPRALSSALNYYRAAFRDLLRSRREELPVITQPTLVLWGERDGALSTNLLDGLEKYVQQLDVVRYPDVGHWVHIDAAERVNAELRRFLGPRSPFYFFPSSYPNGG